MMDYYSLPDDLLLQILLKLPVKSLIRFTLVSKSWLSLITSPHLSSSYISHHTPRSTTLLLRRYDTALRKERYSFLPSSSPEFDPPFSIQLGYFRIVGTSNGILCLCDDLFGQLRSLVLWNPSIHRFTTLPMPSVNPLSPHMFVLGFGPCGDDYKLVRLVYRKGEDILSSCVVPPEVEIFSLNSGAWRRVVGGVEIKHCVVDYMWSQAFVHGAVHWIAFSVFGDNAVARRCVIIPFSLRDEAFGEILLPDALTAEMAANLSIMEFEGSSIAVVKYQREIHATSCEVWVMKQYGVVESWTRLYVIDLVPDMERLVGFTKNGEVLLSTASSDLVSYDPNTRHKEDLGIQGSPRSFNVHSYTESLVLLQGNSSGLDQLMDGIRNLWIQ